MCLPDGAVHIHRKLHASAYEGISDGGSYTVFDTPWGVRVGVLICLDNNIVENVRATALLGAQILLAPHQTGGTHSMIPFGEDPIPVSVWENRAADPGAVEDAFRGTTGREWPLRCLPARARDNGMFIVFSNGVGRDDDEVRTGNAMLVDPCGRIIAETLAITDDMVAADLDLDQATASVGQWWIRFRRPELYRPLLRPRPVNPLPERTEGLIVVQRVTVPPRKDSTKAGLAASSAGVPSILTSPPART